MDVRSRITGPECLNHRLFSTLRATEPQELMARAVADSELEQAAQATPPPPAREKRRSNSASATRPPTQFQRPSPESGADQPTVMQADPDRGDREPPRGSGLPTRLPQAHALAANGPRSFDSPKDFDVPKPMCVLLLPPAIVTFMDHPASRRERAREEQG